MDEEIEEKLSTKSGDREVQVRVEAKWATAVLTACCPSSPPLVLTVPQYVNRTDVLVARTTLLDVNAADSGAVGHDYGYQSSC